MTDEKVTMYCEAAMFFLYAMLVRPPGALLLPFHTDQCTHHRLTFPNEREGFDYKLYELLIYSSALQGPERQILSSMGDRKRRLK